MALDKYSKELYDKYYEHFVAVEKGYITMDELYLNIYLGEGQISKKEYDYWMERIENEKIQGDNPAL